MKRKSFLGTKESSLSSSKHSPFSNTIRWKKERNFLILIRMVIKYFILIQSIFSLSLSLSDSDTQYNTKDLNFSMNSHHLFCLCYYFLTVVHRPFFYHGVKWALENYWHKFVVTLFNLYMIVDHKMFVKIELFLTPNFPHKTSKTEPKWKEIYIYNCLRSLQCSNSYQ